MSLALLSPARVSSPKLREMRDRRNSLDVILIYVWLDLRNIVDYVLDADATDPFDIETDSECCES